MVAPAAQLRHEGIVAEAIPAIHAAGARRDLDQVHKVKAGGRAGGRVGWNVEWRVELAAAGRPARRRSEPVSGLRFIRHVIAARICRGAERSQPGSLLFEAVPPEAGGRALRQGGYVLSPPPWLRVWPNGAVWTHAPYPHQQLRDGLASGFALDIVSVGVSSRANLFDSDTSCASPGFQTVSLRLRRGRVPTLAQASDRWRRPAQRRAFRLEAAPGPKPSIRRSP